jgi:hypothetical protein
MVEILSGRAGIFNRTILIGSPQDDNASPARETQEKAPASEGGRYTFCVGGAGVEAGCTVPVPWDRSAIGPGSS